MAARGLLPKQRVAMPADAANIEHDPFDSDNDSDMEFLIEKTENVDLYYADGECYIYKQKGKDNGEPTSRDCIIYDTVPNEVIAISNKPATNKYAECMLPIKGYVYLPLPHINEDSNDVMNQHIFQKRNYTAQRFTKIEETPHGRNDPQYSAMSDQTSEETKLSKFLTSKAVKRTILFFRTYPFLPGLLILLIQAGIEILAIADLATDIIVTSQLKQSHNPILFGISASLVAAPFVIAWTVASQTILSKYERAHRKNRYKKCWTIILALYDIAPIGITMVLLFEIYHWIETIIVIPCYWVFSLGKRHRTQSYQELGYYKLRKVSEVFAESLPQAIFQLCLLFDVFGPASCEKCNAISVIQSLITSMVVLVLWCGILFFEARANGLSFGEYVAVTFQGSFDFVPYLPAIERGSVKGKFVNWSDFKIRTESFGQISKSVYSKECKLERLKVSQYTIQSLRRLKCRFLGSRLKILSIRNNLEIIVSRGEQELHAFFEKYDLDDSGSFDFIEFVKIFLSLNSMVHERAIMTDIYSVWFKVADKRTNVIWMLDLLLNAAKSTEFLPLIDYKSPLLHAYEKDNINLVTFLVSANYQLSNAGNDMEFNICVIRAVMDNNLKLAACLCENVGIPIVVCIKSAKMLEFVDQTEDDSKYDDDDMNPYLTINLLGQEKVTQICRDTNNPNWNENLLFIIGFEVINDILQANITKKSREFQPVLMHNKSVQEVDEMHLRHLANNSYQRTKKRRSKKQKQYNLVSTEEDEILATDYRDPSISNYNFPKYLNFGKGAASVSMLKKESLSLTLGRKLQKRPSDFANYILQKEQGFIIIALTANSKLFGQQNERKADKESGSDVGDKYIGKTYVTIDLKGDTSSYHEKIRTFELNHLLKKKGKLTHCGELSCKLYLNVLQRYQDAAAKAAKLKNEHLGTYTPMELIVDTDI